MSKQNIFFFFVVLFFATNVQAQKYDISGMVTDRISGDPLVGVFVTTGDQGAQTNYNGEYKIKGVKAHDKLVLTTVYYSSYATKNIRISLPKDTIVNISLTEVSLDIDPVVITGTRTEKRLSDAPVLTTVISAKEIDKAAALTPLEALEDNVPGIVTSYNAMGNNLRIRGLNSRYILFLVDGERMVSEGAGGNVNLDQIDVNSIERIEMINGAASALYGSNAVGAVINIITKEPEHIFEAGAGTSYESNNTWRANVNAGVNTKKFSTLVSGFRNSSGGFGKIGEFPYASPYTDWGGNLKLAYKPVKGADVNVTARYFRHETFNPEGSLNATHPLTHSISGGVNGGYISKDGKNNIRASVNLQKYFDTDFVEQSEESIIGSTASYISARAINTYQLRKKWEFVGGLEYNHEENYSDNTLGSEPTTKTLDDMNIFAQAEYTPLKDFDILAGARYTYNSQFKSAFNPKLSLMYKIKGFTFRGGVGTAFRAPSIKELYYNFDHQGMFWIYGNPDLKAENGLYSSLSTEYTRGVFNISLSGYWNEISNKINQYSVINAAGMEEKYYENVSSATLRGADVNISYVLLREVVLKGSYSFCDAINNETGLQLSSNVKHSGTVSVTWNGKIMRSPFSLQMAGRFSTPRLYQSIETNEDGSTTTLDDQSKPYNIWKLTIVKPFRIKEHTLELTFKCNNIFNFTDDSFVNSGTQYMVGIRYKFK